MHLVIFGLSVSSSWGNGHATLWRALARALTRRGHTVAFYERDVPYYASARDGWVPPQGFRLHLYESLDDVRNQAAKDLHDADMALFTSFCPDGPEAARLILDSRAAIKAFYDLDTPVTLDALQLGRPPAYLPAEGLEELDLVLSFTGGSAMTELQAQLGVRVVAPLYGSVDPEAHHPVAPLDHYRGELSYLGTYAADRQQALEELFLEPAGRLPEKWFQLAGAQFPAEFPWRGNVKFVRHLEPAQHSAFLCSSRATLNITREAMKRYGYCPSGRLFEAAGCGVPILSDGWIGLEMFLAPGKEILRVKTAQDVVEALQRSDAELRAMADAAREHVLAKHTADRRVQELEAICEHVLRGNRSTAMGR